MRIRRSRLGLLLVLLICACGAWLVLARAAVRATSGGDPYEVPNVVDTNPDPHIVQTTMTAEKANVDIGNGVIAHADTFNGSIPGPTFSLHVGDTVIVHFQNHLDRASAIHWHGIELSNERTARRSPRTGPAGRDVPLQVQGHPARDLLVPPARPSSTDQVFAGLYGMIVVTDPTRPPSSTPARCRRLPTPDRSC